MTDTLERSVPLLEPMINRLVFMGHQVTGLLVANRAAVKRRPTFNLDAVVTAVSYSALDRLSVDLARLGFQQDGVSTARTGRWRTSDGLALEVVPSDAIPDGAQYPWYAYALECTLAVPFNARTIRVAGAPAFLALKLAAFAERGAGAAQPNADLEDALTVLVNRPNVEREIATAPVEVRRFIGEQFALLAGRGDADSVLERHIADAEHFPILAVRCLERVRRVAAS